MQVDLLLRTYSKLDKEKKIASQSVQYFNINNNNSEQKYNHKLFIVSPEILAKEGVSFYKVIKKIGEYIGSNTKS